jgi:protein-S-isoprenylcysteine O-methyltransferase Ste14
MGESIRRISKGQVIIVILPNIFYFVILVIALLLTGYFPQIPWQLLSGASLLFPGRFAELLTGTILLVLGVMFIVWGVTSLGRDRAQGGEIGLTRRTSTLVTVGAYSYCRHPQTLGFILATPALALMFDFVPLLIVALLYTPLQLALLGYEEMELLRRFRDTYGTYREAVPFIIPRGKRIIPTTSSGGDK